MFKHGMPRRAVAAGVAAASMGVALVAGTLSGTAGATGDEPEHVPGNPKCEDLGYEFGVKIEAPATDADGFSITFDDDDNIHFTAPNGVDAVIVKAGPGANVYTYDPPVTSGGPLETPDGKDLSHIDFCWNEGDEPGVTTTVPGDTTTTVPGEEPPGEEPPGEEPGDDDETPPVTAPPATPVPAEPPFTG